jgi:hypothetical protein
MSEISLHVRLIQEDGAWSAQCLEYDICAQGSTRQESLERFHKTALGQTVLDYREGKRPFEGLRPAPFIYWHDIRFRELEIVRVEPYTGNTH